MLKYKNKQANITGRRICHPFRGDAKSCTNIVLIRPYLISKQIKCGNKNRYNSTENKLVNVRNIIKNRLV